jgi:hypothetical protein
MKNRFGASVTRSIGVIQHNLHATEQHLACHPRWRLTVKNIAYASLGVVIFYETDLLLGA